MKQLFQKYLTQCESRFSEIKYKENPEIIVVIPAFNEPDIFRTYESLLNANSECKVLVLTVVNFSERANESAKAFNMDLFHLASDWGVSNSTNLISFRAILVPNVRRKHAGAGYARKVGMDTATEIFSLFSNENGVIVSLDADCNVSSNYFRAIGEERRADVQVMDFEHQKEELSGNQLDAMIDYEMYLHYFVLGTRMAGFPYAYHTIGSCFAVTVYAYMKNGGMNKKHAGEDFYFLHKMFPNSNVIRNYKALVSPSGRVSDRVPFGTGPALTKIMQDTEPFKVYHPAAIIELKKLFDFFYDSYTLEQNVDLDIFEPGLNDFLDSVNFKAQFKEARQNSSNQLTFTKRLFQHFNAFQVVKYLNYVHENGYYLKMPIMDASRELFGKQIDEVVRRDEALQKLREWERATSLRQLR